ncbi:inovirus-type Gp2 protein, partial [Salmonella enterica subsp. enterica]|nr:inovirus Gp2 family protein [Salmonella enterica subsp. enterica serovar Poona]ECC9940894.1 inovirus Gp2 family protein [Salmonella enterica subsp. enterica]EJI0210302.1 inovirus-type Gp2 protein [Salmonella enterica subsp. enterica]
MQNKQRWEQDWFLGALLNNHTDKMVERYSCLRALRIDLFYQDHTAKFFLHDHRQLEWDVRKLMNRMMQPEAVVGFFWVIEWTEDHHYHAHVVFWLDGSKTQNTYPWAQQAGLYWSDITDREGWYYRC